MTLVLRGYQERGDQKIRAAFHRVRRVLFVSCCGSGKTVNFSKIAQGAAAKKKSVAMIAHRKELITQCSSKLRQFDVDHGIIKAGFDAEYEKPIQVASIQTLHARPGVIDPDLLIIDEAHHSQSKTYQEVVDRHPEALLLGVTASPIFGNGRTLGGFYDEMVIGATVRELIDDGYLVRTRVFAPPPVIDLRGADYDNLSDLEARANKRTVTGDAIDHYERLTPGEQAIVTCVTVQHAKDVAEAFRARGHAFWAIDGTMGDTERDKLLDDHARGVIQGLCSCDLIGEGTDIPSARVMIKLRPTDSLGLNIQHDGRVNRPDYAPDMPRETADQRKASIAASAKPWATIIDHVGNYEFHGWPDDEWEWSLTLPPKRKERGPVFAVSQCEVCYCHYRGATCDSCGSPRTVKTRQITYTKGELVEIKKEEAAARKEADKQQMRQKLKERSAAKTLNELVVFAEKWGYDSPEEWARQWQKIRSRQRGRK